jgi:predicted DNA-binding protein (UPF0251 family)
MSDCPNDQHVGAVEVIAMCSNTRVNRAFDRLLKIHQGFYQDPRPSTVDTRQGVGGSLTANAPVFEPHSPSGQEIPYSPKRHLSSSEIEQIVAGYLAGTTARELGERYEVDRKTVSRILKANGVTMRLHPMQPEEIEHAVRLYESGMSLTKVAEHLPYDASTIWREFKHRGVVTRDIQGRPLPSDSP